MMANSMLPISTHFYTYGPFWRWGVFQMKTPEAEMMLNFDGISCRWFIRTLPALVWTDGWFMARVVCRLTHGVVSFDPRDAAFTNAAHFQPPLPVLGLSLCTCGYFICGLFHLTNHFSTPRHTANRDLCIDSQGRLCQVCLCSRWHTAHLLGVCPRHCLPYPGQPAQWDPPSISVMRLVLSALCSLLL